jgi:hypothetical protein
VTNKNPDNGKSPEIYRAHLSVGDCLVEMLFTLQKGNFSKSGCPFCSRKGLFSDFEITVLDARSEDEALRPDNWQYKEGFWQITHALREILHYCGQMSCRKARDKRIAAHLEVLRLRGLIALIG